MTSLDIAVVSRDPEIRLAAARAFDRAPASWKVSLHKEPPPTADTIVFGVDMRTAANGQLVFDPVDGGDLVGEIKRAVSSARNKVFVIAGAGRGVGVTTLGLHLAAHSARRRPTCFFDLDLCWGAARRLAIESPHRTWADDTGEDGIALAALPVSGGFRVLLAPRGCETESDRHLRRGLEVMGRAAEAFDRVIVDCGDAAWLEDVLEPADAGVFVVPATLPAAQRAAELLDEHAGKARAVVLNRLGPGGETSRAELHRAMGRRATVELPTTPALRDTEDEGILLTSPWPRYVRRTARLLDALEAAT